MNPEKPTAVQTPEELMFLSFWSMGVRFAVEAGQVLEICRPVDIREKGMRIMRLQETMHFSTQRGGYQAPRILMPRNESLKAGLEVDCLDNVMSIAMESIFPLPPLIAGFHPSMALWGVAASQLGLILLIDLIRLVRSDWMHAA